MCSFVFNSKTHQSYIMCSANNVQIQNSVKSLWMLVWDCQYQNNNTEFELKQQCNNNLDVTVLIELGSKRKRTPG